MSRGGAGTSVTRCTLRTRSLSTSTECTRLTELALTRRVGALVARLTIRTCGARIACTVSTCRARIYNVGIDIGTVLASRTTRTCSLFGHRIRSKSARRNTGPIFRAAVPCWTIFAPQIRTRYGVSASAALNTGCGVCVRTVVSSFT